MLKDCFAKHKFKYPSISINNQFCVFSPPPKMMERKISALEQIDKTMTKQNKRNKYARDADRSSYEHNIILNEREQLSKQKVKSVNNSSGQLAIITKWKKSKTRTWPEWAVTSGDEGVKREAWSCCLMAGCHLCLMSQLVPDYQSPVSECIINSLTAPRLTACVPCTLHDKCTVSVWFPFRLLFHKDLFSFPNDWV